MAPVLRRSVRTRAGTHGRLAPLRHPNMGIPLPIRGQPSVSLAGAPAFLPAVGGLSPFHAWSRQLSTLPVRFWKSLTALVNPAHTAVPVLHCTSSLGLAFGLGTLGPRRRLNANALLRAPTRGGGRLGPILVARPSPNRGLVAHFQGCAYRMAVALLRFNFNYGNFIRWLGGEYTGAHQDWDARFDIVDSVRLASIPPGYPEVDFDRAVRIATKFVPLAGRFECQFASVHKRERHDSGSLASDVLAAVGKKFTKEEKLSYHILFPRFLWAFPPGLFLALITWVPPKGQRAYVC